MATEYRVITWTDRDGIKNVSDTMPLEDAEELCSTIREANPPWLHVAVEEDKS
jgi:hypothetical protein